MVTCAVEVTFKCTYFRDGCPTLASAFVYAKDLVRRHVCAAQRSVPVHVAFASGKVTWKQEKGEYRLSVPEDSPQRPAWGVTPVACCSSFRRPHDDLDPHAAGLSLRHARKTARFPGALEQGTRILSGSGKVRGGVPGTCPLWLVGRSGVCGTRNLTRSTHFLFGHACLRQKWYGSLTLLACTVVLPSTPLRLQATTRSSCTTPSLQLQAGCHPRTWPQAPSSGAHRPPVPPRAATSRARSPPPG